MEAELKAEAQVLKKLKKQYKEALDGINDNIAALKARTDTENLQSIVYQVQYQEALKTQISGILDDLESKQFTTVSEYLTECYENGFLGAMYDIHDQGIPIIFPIDQKQVVNALTVDSKLSKPLYQKLGESTTKLKHNLQRNLSRGIAQGESYYQIAQSMTKEMVGDYSRFRGGAFYIAERIVRTEGHRITNQAKLDSMQKAIDAGADVVKQWDATLDRRTRPEHAKADGQIREMDEDFEVWGEKLPAPGIGGSARNVINCRCRCLQRARWALDDDELQTLKDRAAYYGLDKTKDFEDFKKKYMDALDNGADFIDVSFKQKIDDLKVKSRTNTGAIEQETIKEAGKVVRDEIETKYDYSAKRKALRQLNQDYQDEYVMAEKRSKRIEQQMDDIRKELYGEFDPFEALIREAEGTAEPILVSPEKAKELEDKLEKLNEKWLHVYDKSNELAEKCNEAQKELQKLEKSMVKDTLSEVRKMGYSDNSVLKEAVEKHLLGQSQMRKTVLQAYDYYPSEWIEKSINRGRLTPRKVNRGYYDDWNEIIAISDGRGDGGLQTATHELGHRMEKAIPGILESEKDFFNKRIEGESLQKLSKITGNPSYRASEVAYKDNFLNPYMGKDYGGYAYELVSMGFELAFNDYARLAQDEDMLNWVLGLLAMY